MVIWVAGSHCDPAILLGRRPLSVAKFNQKNTIKIKNCSGFPAYRMEAKEQLVTAVLTTLFGEPKYYGSTDNTVTTLAAECAKTDAAFLCKLACYARNTGNLRSVSHVLACIIAREVDTRYTPKHFGASRRHNGNYVLLSLHVRQTLSECHETRDGRCHAKV